MKNILLLPLAILSLVLHVSGAPSTNYVISARGPHSRTWTAQETNRSAAANSPNSRRPAARRGSTVVELGTGMNYWNGSEWIPSEPVFEVSSERDAFVAARVQHKIRLAADIATADAVTVTTPDGIVLKSTPLAIGLFDAA